MPPPFRVGAGAWIHGREATLEEAEAAAAEILGTARQPVVAGLGTCAAGAVACAALARALGGVLDHAHSAASLRGLDAVRQGTTMLTTPPQVRARADLVLLVGEGIAAAWPDAFARLGLDGPPTLAPEERRRVLRLCPGREPAPVPGVEAIGRGERDLPVLLGALRALVAGRTPRLPGRDGGALAEAAQSLRSAKYGVAIWADAGLDALAAEMLHGLVDDLNLTTRFAALPLPAAGNAAGVAQALTGTTGFPLRVGFGRGAPEHDPWRFDAARLVGSGEADAALWVSALDLDPPPWLSALPSVVLCAPGTRFAAAPEVAIAVGRPGTDHDGVLFDPGLGALAAAVVAQAGALSSVAGVLTRIRGRLRAPDAAPC